jgi:ribokinase
MNSAIAVVGSLNMDFVVRAEHLPAPGETVLGRDFEMIPGGKGANQACAAGRLAQGQRVRMAGRVGYDVFADHLRASLAASGVDVSHVAGARSHPTGIAMIAVDAGGQNTIIVASGANFAFQASEVEGMRAAFRGAAWALFQLETPVDTVAAAMKLARSEGAKTMLDPAPARTLPRELLDGVDLITPNETEACILLGRTPGRVTLEEAPALAKAVRELIGGREVVLKLGDRGALYTDGERTMIAPAFGVKAVDSTAAGDTFNGALAVALTEGRAVEDALWFANAAAAISVTRVGAQASVPTRKEVDEFLAAH